MVLVQAAGLTDEALDLIDLRTVETHPAADEVARDVVDHVVRFAPVA